MQVSPSKAGSIDPINLMGNRISANPIKVWEETLKCSRLGLDELWDEANIISPIQLL